MSAPEGRGTAAAADGESGNRGATRLLRSENWGKWMSQQASWADRMAELFVVANSETAQRAKQLADGLAELASCQQEEWSATNALEQASKTEGLASSELEAFDTAGVPVLARYGRIVASVLIVLGLALFCLVINQSSAGAAALTFLASTIFAGATFVVSGNARRKHDSRRAQLTGDLRDASQQRSVAQAAVAEARSRREALEAQVQTIKVESPLRTIGQVLLPVRSVKVGGYSALVDESGAVPPTKIALPELPASESVLATVDEAVAAAKARPALLDATSTSTTASDPGQLHGQERQLADAMRQFSEMIEGARVQESTVRLVDRDDGLAALARKGGQTEPLRGVVLRRGGDAKAAAALISSSLGRSRSGGGDARDRLKRASASLQEAAAGMGALRSNAVRHVHDAVASVVERSHFAHSRFYCPRCNQVPQYLFHRVGLDENTAHQLDPAELLERLQQDPDAAARIDREPSLVEKLAQTIEKLGELRATLATAEADMDRARSSNVPITELRVREAMLRAHRSELEKILVQFRASVRQIVTGQIRPLTELSRQATLELNPDSQRWTCASCSTVFDDPYVARMGQVLRIRDELMMPMWAHLWAEKADFCRSEVFRSNEQVANLIEKESVAMRDIAEQYRADMRPVRENLIRSVSEAMQGRERLTDTLQSLVALGAASRRDVDARVQELGEMTGGDLAAMKQRAERKESFLVQLPLGQVVARPGLLGPVEQQSDPTEVFHRLHAAAAPILVADFEEVD